MSGTNYRLSLLMAIGFAQHPGGTTAGEVAEALGWPVRRAQGMLLVMKQQGVLMGKASARKGKARGDWRTVYTVAPGVAVAVKVDTETLRALIPPAGLELDEAART
jgi:hypothetical protein